MATLQANKDVVRRFYEGWNGGAIDFEALVAEEIVNYQPEAEPERGRERFAAAIRGVMNAVPDSRWDVVEAIAEDDRVVVRITWSGTYKAPQFRGASIPEPALLRRAHPHL